MELKFTFRGYQKSCKEFVEMVSHTVAEHDMDGLYCSSVLIKSCGIEDRDQELMAELKSYSLSLFNMTKLVNTF